MEQNELGAAVDRALAGLRFDEAMREEVRRRAALPARARRQSMRPLVVAAAVCALLLTAALAAAPTVWELIQGHLGNLAPYAREVEGRAVDRGVALEPAAALADQNLIRVYFTLRDLEGDRLDETLAATLQSKDYPSINGGKPLEAVGYDADTGEAAFCQTFYTRDCPDSLTLSISELTPGYRPFRWTLSGAELDEWVPRAPLKSAEDAEGRTYLLPDQNPISLAQDHGSLPGGEAPALSVSSLGFAGDGRLHVRLAVDEAVCPVGDWSLSLSGGMYALEPTPVEGGVDYAFPPEVITRDDLANVFFLLIQGAYSVSGGALEGDWSVTIPLEPVERRAMTAPGGPVTEAWLSPLGLSIRFQPGGEPSAAVDRAILVLDDGSRTERSLCRQDESRLEGQAVWSFEAPIDLDTVAALELNGTVFSYTK